MADWLIVGLGNPGRQYEETRHNVGFQTIDRLSQEAKIDLSRRRANAFYGQGSVAGGTVILAKPQTYMNDSGVAVRGLLSWFKLDPKALVVVYDDLDLPVGRIRLRPAGSAGGHNGVRSIIQQLGSDSFARVRIGIGRPRSDGIDHVLGKFAPDERPIVADAIARASEAVTAIVADGLDAAMNRFNA